jgi:alanyl-tRNA synthetase
VNGRGGGSPRLAQGAVPDPSQLPAVLKALGFAEALPGAPPEA